MNKVLAVFYGVFCYAAFFASFLYAVAFNADAYVPRTVDHGPSAPPAVALLIDLAVLGVFAIQHSGMARRAFKQWLTRWMPASIERSTYVLLSSAALGLVLWQWRAIDAVVWSAQAPWAVVLLYAIQAAGWVIVLSSSFVINHFDLFGLRQVWMNLRGRRYAPVQFQERLHYRLVRHPLMLGFLIAFWATPRMSAGHLLFAAGTTAYILLALQLEERDLLAAHGDEYRSYKARVPSLLPWPRPAASGAAHDANPAPDAGIAERQTRLQ
jgi:protein-S-isoprenylcysteine O-methyltransferase Ste14